MDGSAGRLSRPGRCSRRRLTPYLEDVMVDFPDITVVIGHTGFMLAEEVIFFMGKFANVWGDFAYWAEASRSGRWRRSGASRRRWGHEPLHLGHLIRTSRSATVWISSRRLRRTRKSTSSNPSSPRKTRPDFSATTPRGCLASGNRWESRVDPIKAVRDEIADLSRGDLEAVLRLLHRRRLPRRHDRADALPDQGPDARLHESLLRRLSRPADRDPQRLFSPSLPVYGRYGFISLPLWGRAGWGLRHRRVRPAGHDAGRVPRPPAHRQGVPNQGGVDLRTQRHALHQRDRLLRLRVVVQANRH